jgi:hypothetical protein
MLHTYEFCSERADEAQALAESATLDNVKQRELRSEKSWRGLAELARNAADGRVKANLERAERRAAEAESDASRQLSCGLSG